MSNFHLVFLEFHFGKENNFQVRKSIWKHVDYQVNDVYSHQVKKIFEIFGSIYLLIVKHTHE